MRKKQMLKRAAAVILSAAMAVGVVVSMPSLYTKADSWGRMAMYRLYNPNSGEHFYTSDSDEHLYLTSVGWKYEGIGWFAPTSSSTPVYRLYNPNTGDHHFTTNSSERQNCIKAGWRDENIGWYSDDQKSVPLYREYNSNVVIGTHNYTSNKSEHDHLVSKGWKDEGVGWYGVTPPDSKYYPGDIVILGTYEQDNDLSNGPEPIEWVVLGERDSHTLLLSKYALDGHKPYNEEYVDITWENCTLRSWLNNDFYNTAFTASEKEKIITSHNENPGFDELLRRMDSISDNYSDADGAEGGNPTDDKVFLLNFAEMLDCVEGKLYVGDREKGNYKPLRLLCRPTVYAKKKVYIMSYNPDYDPSDTLNADCCYWWLRSPGSDQRRALLGYRISSFNESRVDEYWHYGVRPAILID